MKRISSFSILTAVVVLLIGISGCNGLVSKSPLPLFKGGSPANPAAAIFVSKQAPAMVSLLVNPDRLDALGQIVSGKNRSQSRTNLKTLENNLLASTNLDYQRDIQPWLDDEITLAVTTTDIDRNSENGQQPGYLIVLTTKNAERSREFLLNLFSQRIVGGNELGLETYKGVKLISEQLLTEDASLPESLPEQQAAQKKSKEKDILQPPLQNIFTGAAVGDRFVLLANHPRVLRDAINNVQAADLNLTSSNYYQQALSLLPDSRIGMTFLNLPSVAGWLGSHAQTYQSQIISLELKRQGLLAQTALLKAPEISESLPAPAKKPNGALKYMPSTAGFSISGFDLSSLENSDLNQLWTEISSSWSSSSSDAISRLIKQPLSDSQSRWGIDLQKDIFSWVKGEYALGLVPPFDNRSVLDWIFVTEKTEASDEGISRLNAIAQAQGLNVTPLLLENQKVAAWTQLTTDASSAPLSEQAITFKAKVQGVHTTVENYEIFTTSVKAMDQALKAVSSNLTNNPKFQAGVDNIPQPNAGYIYLDWAETQASLKRQLPILQLLEVVAEPFFSNVRSLTTSSYSSEPGVLKGGIFFKF